MIYVCMYMCICAMLLYMKTCIRTCYLAYVHVFLADHLKLEKLGGSLSLFETTYFSFQSHWLPVVLHPDIGSHGISPIYINMSIHVVIIPIFLRQLYSWLYMGSFFHVMSRGHHLAADVWALGFFVLLR